jgi:hypothetical protein
MFSTIMDLFDRADSTRRFCTVFRDFSGRRGAIKR